MANAVKDCSSVELLRLDVKRLLYDPGESEEGEFNFVRLRLKIPGRRKLAGEDWGG